MGGLLSRNKNVVPVLLLNSHTKPLEPQAFDHDRIVVMLIGLI